MVSVKKAIRSLRLRLHSGLRQSGGASSTLGFERPKQSLGLSPGLPDLGYLEASANAKQIQVQCCGFEEKA